MIQFALEVEFDFRVSLGTQVDGSWQKGDTLPKIQKPNTVGILREAPRT
tara:strand:- start:712 stop:858 length:147 start_codon:yes stop_codon:yes gene_type:complete